MNGSPNPIDNMPSVESLLTGMAVVYGLLALIGLALTVFWIVEVVDIARREFPDQNTKVLWLIVVLLFHGLGSLIYYFVGKPQGWLPGETPKYAPQAPAYYPPPPPPESRPK